MVSGSPGVFEAAEVEFFFWQMVPFYFSMDWSLEVGNSIVLVLTIYLQLRHLEVSNHNEVSFKFSRFI